MINLLSKGANENLRSFLSTNEGANYEEKVVVVFVCYVKYF